MKIAVIGSGISGLSAAHFLSKKYKVDLFEKNDEKDSTLLVGQFEKYNDFYFPTQGPRSF